MRATKDEAEHSMHGRCAPAEHVTLEVHLAFLAALRPEPCALRELGLVVRLVVLGSWEVGRKVHDDETLHSSLAFSPVQ